MKHHLLPLDEQCHEACACCSNLPEELLYPWAGTGDQEEITVSIPYPENQLYVPDLFVANNTGKIEEVGPLFDDCLEIGDQLLSVQGQTQVFLTSVKETKFMPKRLVKTITDNRADNITVTFLRTIPSMKKSWKAAIGDDRFNALKEWTTTNAYIPTRKKVCILRFTLWVLKECFSQTTRAL